MNFSNWLNEHVESQSFYLIPKIEKIFLYNNPDIEKKELEILSKDALSILSQEEKKLNSEEDKQKSYTINKFLNNLSQKKYNGFSNHHILDLFKSVDRFIYSANIKDPNQRKNIIKNEISKKIPNINAKDLEELTDRILNHNIKLDKAVDDYMKLKEIDKKFEIIAKFEDYNMVKIENFVADGQDKHLDSGSKEDCHVLFKGTKWCTRFRNYFYKYTNEGPLYLIRKGNVPLFLGHKDSDFLDVNDEMPSESAIENIIVPITLKSKESDLIKSILRHTKNGLFEIYNEVGKYKFKEIFSKISNFEFYGFLHRDTGKPLEKYSQYGECIVVSETFRTYNDLIHSKNKDVNLICNNFVNFPNIENVFSENNFDESQKKKFIKAFKFSLAKNNNAFGIFCDETFSNFKICILSAIIMVWACYPPRDTIDINELINYFQPFQSDFSKELNQIIKEIVNKEL